MQSTEPFVESRADENPQLLRQRFQQLGYLFFRGYAQGQACSELLGELLAQTEGQVELDDDSALPVLRGSPFAEADPHWDRIYPRIQALESFHAFFHSGSMLALMRRVCGEEVFVYPMKMARISTPGRIGHETPPHQDAYSHHAGPTMAGIWVALHAIDAGMGRITVLPGSHRGGVRKVFGAQGVGGVQCEIYPGETTWHASDCGRGDVLIFHSATVHKAEPNTTASTVRISVDTRFCNRGAPVFYTNLEPHHGWRIEGLDWEHIYRGWKNPGLQYYWRDYPNLF